MLIAENTASRIALLGAIAILGCAGQQKGETTPSPAQAEAAEPPQAAEPPEPAQVASVETREVDYSAGDTRMKGLIAYPADAEAKRPAVLVVHEWWGLNEYSRRRAAQLAELGYVAMAVDMFGDGKQANHPDDAKKFMMEVMGNMAEATARFEAARAVLASDPRVDPERIAAIGYCMGGAVVLHMARLGKDLDAVASFHGNLATQSPLKPGVFQGRILVAHGGADPFVPPEQLADFEREMKAAAARYEVVVYPNAVHGFTNPEATAIGERFGTPHRYDPQADADSWKRLEQLLAQVWPESQS